MSSTDTDADRNADLPEEPEKPQLSMEVEVETRGACQRHLIVSVSQADVDRYVSEAFDELQPKAEVRGFRPGRAPRKLVEMQFKDQIREQVKGKIIMDALAQVSDEQKMSAISEPDFDFDAITVPEDGPFKFEFDIEVRPEFDVPEWKGMPLMRPVRETTDEDVDRQLKRLLTRYGKQVPRDGAVEAGDTVTVDMAVMHAGQEVAAHPQVKLSVVPEVRFSDATLAGFDQLVMGAARGDVRETTVTVGADAPNEPLREQDVQVRVTVNEVETLELPELTPSFLDEIGGFEDEDDLREVVRAEMDRQVLYFEQRRLRNQITERLLQGADWDLPPDLLRRQAHRELQRTVLELQASGFSEAEIRAHSNQIKQNSLRNTATALKEHFILEKIAEQAEIDVVEDDYEQEIRLIAAQRDEPVRRVRARLEKQGEMDALRNQIVERKVIDLICQYAQITEEPMAKQQDDAFGVDMALCGGHEEVEIPEAKHGGEPEDLRKPADHS